MIYERLSDELREQRKTESKLIFAKVYAKTLAVLGVNEVDAPCSAGEEECWIELRDIWKIHSNKIGCDVIYAATYHIAWDRYPVSDLSTACLDLLELVEQCLVAEGYAYEVWYACGAVGAALDSVRNTVTVHLKTAQCKSKWFGRYLYATTFSRICIKERPTTYSCVGMRRADIGMFHSTDMAKYHMREFEKVIERLIPYAAAWTRQNWTDESAIMREIHKLHGVNYELDSKAFDQLLDVFSAVVDGRDYDRRLMLLDQLPVSMIPCLWPNDTQSKMERYFIRICKRTRRHMKANPNTRSAFRTNVLMGSWVWQYYFNGTMNPPQKVKTEKYNVMIGI